MSEVEKDNPSDLQRFTLELKSLRGAVSITALAQTTKISARFIQALEEGRFEELPGRVFARGFIRNICKLKGRNPNDLLELYDRLTHAAPAAEYPIAAATTTNDRVAAPLLPVRTAISQIRLPDLTPGIQWIQSHASRKTVVLSAVVLMTGLVAWNLWKIIPRSATKPEVKTATVIANPVEAPVQIPEQSLETSAAREKTLAGDLAKDAEAELEESNVVETAAPVVAATSAVEVEVIEAVRMKVTKKGQTSEILELSPGSQTISFDKEVELMIYDAAAVRLSYDGRQLGNLGKKGRIRRIAFSTP